MRDMLRKLCCLGMCLFLFLAAGCKEKETMTLQEVTEENLKEDTKEDKKEPLPEEVVQDLYVYVCGEVNEPGVYELKPGSRVYAAVQAAGGMTETADPNYLNQAESLTDGQRIYVPSRKETESSGGSSNGLEPAGEKESGKVNLNTAGKEELMTLTGIGEAKAESIMRYREEHGAFQKPEDLMKIEGIKSGVFNKIKEHIIVQ